MLHDLFFVPRFRSFVFRKRIERKLQNLILGKRNADIDRDRLVPRRIPKIVWIFWAQGEASAPDVVAHCIQSWRLRNPDWDVRVMDRAVAEAYADMSDLPDSISLAHYADVLRVRLLEQFGGIWADATLYCSAPLDTWCSRLTQNGFFAFCNPHPDRIISNWFLMSEPHGYVISHVSNQVTAYWSRVSKADHYLWFHYLFEWMVKTDSAFARAWSRVPKVSADAPLLMRRCIEAGREPNWVERIDVEAIPVHKLTWKTDLPAASLRRWGIS